jgi:DnaJ family protein C protein 9
MSSEGHVKALLLAAMNTANPYEILEIAAVASPEEIKKAYRVQALKSHPDKGGDAEKFKAVSIAHSILSDPEKRAVFDQTGDVDESGEELDEASFETWYAYYRTMFPPITTSMIDSFSAKYKNSEEERGDVLSSYSKFGGDMAKIMDSTILAEAEDYERIEAIVNSAITSGEIKRTAHWDRRGKRGNKKRGVKEGDLTLMEDEEEEEEDEEDEDDDNDDAQEGRGKKQAAAGGKKTCVKAAPSKGKAKATQGKQARAKTKTRPPSSSNSASQSLEALILSRQRTNAALYDGLARKYHVMESGSEAYAEPEISDDEFARIQASIMRKGGGDDGEIKSKAKPRGKGK